MHCTQKNSELIDAASVGIGSNSIAIASGIAVGSNSSANINSVAVGPNSPSTQQAVSIGLDTQSVSGGVSVGTSANAGQNAVSIGVGSFSASSGVCLGRNTVCNVNGVALGSYSNTLKDITAVGYTSSSFSAGSTAIGISSQACLTGTFNASIALGRSAKCYDDDSICIENSSTIPSTTKNTIVLGIDFNPETMENNALYVAQVRTDSSPTHIMYFNNETKEVTYGVNAGSDLEGDVADLTDKIDAALEKVNSASTIVTDIKAIKDDYIKGIILNTNRELEITDGEGVMTTVLSVQGKKGDPGESVSDDTLALYTFKTE